MKTAIGDRMKQYEKHGTGATVMTNLPVIARLDGKSFHTYCKGFNKPFDEILMVSMIETVKYLVEHSNAIIGYTQSDEITLVFNHSYNSRMMFDGKLHKLNSVLASMATAVFNHEISLRKPSDKIAMFDCRVWNVPNKMEAINTLIWREQDAIRNSIMSLGQSVFSHSKLNGKSCIDIKEMLHNENIEWDDYSTKCKRGTYVRREVVERKLTTSELENLPKKHDMRKNPDMFVTRSHVSEIIMLPLSTLSNAIEVVFDGVKEFENKT